MNHDIRGGIYRNGREIRWKTKAKNFPASSYGDEANIGAHGRRWATMVEY